MPHREVPVLFLVFNRPEPTERVMQAIRRARPARLFVAADGPRETKPDEAARCAQVRAIATSVDWPCEVKTLLRSDNLGCGQAVSSAISWFFQEVEQGIILEDDCLPDPSFFEYCAALLERYRDCPEVATISGTNFFPQTFTHRDTHYFSKYFQMWGWATWRRTWIGYDYRLRQLNHAGWEELIRRTHPNPLEANYWRRIYRMLSLNQLNTWDFQVFFSCWFSGAGHLMPARNMVSNLGFGAEATHTAFDSPMANLPATAHHAGDGKVPLAPDQLTDSLIFYMRFMECLVHPSILQWMLDPEQGQTGNHAQQSTDMRLLAMQAQLETAREQLRMATGALQSQTDCSNAVESPTVLQKVLSKVRSKI